MAQTAIRTSLASPKAVHGHYTISWPDHGGFSRPAVAMVFSAPVLSTMYYAPIGHPEIRSDHAMRRYRRPQHRGIRNNPGKCYFRRRDILRLAAAGGWPWLPLPSALRPSETRRLKPSPGGYDPVKASRPKRHVTSYNNFYEFGTGKGDPCRQIR
jgi:hypothetical protein